MRVARTVLARGVHAIEEPGELLRTSIRLLNRGDLDEILRRVVAEVGHHRDLLAVGVLAHVRAHDRGVVVVVVQVVGHVGVHARHNNADVFRGVDVSLRDDRRHARVRGVDPQKLTRHTVFVRAIQRCPDVPDGFRSLLELLESCSLERVNDQASLLLILLVFSLDFRQLDIEHEAVCLIPRRPINTVELADLIRVLINELFFLLRSE